MVWLEGYGYKNSSIPSSDRHHFSLNDINTSSRESVRRTNKWSPKGKRLIDLLFNSPNQFDKEMNGKRSDEFACGSVLGRVKTVFWSSLSPCYNVCINDWKTVHIKIPFFFVVVLSSITFQKSVFSLGDCTMSYHSIDVWMFACRRDVIFSQLSQRGGCLSSGF